MHGPEEALLTRRYSGGMNTVTILRDLWSLRRVVATMALLAVVAGTAVMYKISFPPDIQGRRYEVGIATARILVDTPSSQVVEVAPKGSDSLGVRANLLASLMVDGVVKSAITRRAQLPPSKLIGITDTESEPSPASTKPPGRRALVLKTHVATNADGAQLPIIEVEAQAPDRATARRLGSAAIDGLRDYLDSKAAQQRIPNVDRLQLTGLGAPQVTTQGRGPTAVMAVAVAVIVFLLGCAWILGMLALSRAWRAATVREQLEADAPAQEGTLYSLEEPEDLSLDDDEPEPVEVAPDADDAPREQRGRRRAGAR